MREAVGDEFTLMLDSMWAYQYADALRVGRAIEELGYYWYEDPLAEEDSYNYVDLGQKLDIPIMCTEYAPGRFPGMAAWIMQRATDILRGDVAVTGGITPLVRQCHLAEGFGMRCELHHGGNSLNNVANLHVTMAVPNCEFYEFFPCTGANSVRPGPGHRGRPRRHGARAGRARARLSDRLGPGEPGTHRHGGVRDRLSDAPSTPDPQCRRTPGAVPRTAGHTARLSSA